MLESQAEVKVKVSSASKAKQAEQQLVNSHNSHFATTTPIHAHTPSIVNASLSHSYSTDDPLTHTEPHTFRLEAHQKWSVHTPTDPEVAIIHPGSHFRPANPEQRPLNFISLAPTPLFHATHPGKVGSCQIIELASYVTVQ